MAAIKPNVSISVIRCHLAAERHSRSVIGPRDLCKNGGAQFHLLFVFSAIWGVLHQTKAMPVVAWRDCFIMMAGLGDLFKSSNLIADPHSQFHAPQPRGLLKKRHRDDELIGL